MKKGKSDELFTQGSILIYHLFTASCTLYLCYVKSAVPIRVQLGGGILTFWGYIQVLTKMLGRDDHF